MKIKRWRLLLLLPSLFAVFFALNAWAQQSDPPARVARLSLAQGKVSFQPSGETGWSEASINRPMTTGDRIFADQDGRAELEVGPFAVRLSRNTDVTLANLNDQLLQLGVGQGSVRVTIYELPANNTVEIDTPNGALALQAAGTYRVDTAPDGSSTQVIVNTGALQISAGDLSKTLQSGEAVTLRGTGPVMALGLALPTPDDFDQWCGERDRRIQASASMQSVGQGIPGGEDLDANGQWTNDPSYGMVWYPSNVPPGWAPYRHGHWVHIRPWTWTWVESEPWGYAPFHYGRWVRIHHVWAWIPGPVMERPVYAPALVVFVGGGGAGTQAWIPLGPGEYYTPYYEHSSNYMNEYNRVYVRNNYNVTYVNRAEGMTAVSSETFRSGAPVANSVVHVSPEQAARWQPVTHLEVTPTREATFGAGTVVAPPVHTNRVVSLGPGTPSAWGNPASNGHEGTRTSGPPSTPPPHVFTRNPSGSMSVSPAFRQDPHGVGGGHTGEAQPENNVETPRPTEPAPEKTSVTPPPKPSTPPPPAKTSEPKKNPPPPKPDPKHH